MYCIVLYPGAVKLEDVINRGLDPVISTPVSIQFPLVKEEDRPLNNNKLHIQLVVVQLEVKLTVLHSGRIFYGHTSWRKVV